MGLAVAIRTNSYDVPQHEPARDGRGEHLRSCFRDTPLSLTCHGVMEKVYSYQEQLFCHIV
jgi:hypothetical protein